MRQTSILRPALCGALCLGGLAGPPALAQEEGGIRLSFGIEQRLETGRNLRLLTPAEGSGTVASTILSFGLLTETRIDRLSLLGDTTLRITDLPGEGREVDAGDFDLVLDYRREVADAELTFGATLLREDIDLLRPLGEFVGEGGTIVLPPDFEDLTGGGTRRAFALRAGLELGRQDLLGYVFGLGASGVDYSGTTDPDLVRTRSLDATAAVILRFSPRTTGRLGLAATRTREDDLEETETRTRSATFGLEHELTSRLRGSATLGYRIEETDTLPLGLPPPVTDRLEGAFGTLGLTYDMPNGTIFGTVSSALDGAGRLNTATIGRALEIPDGTFTASLGIADRAGADPELVGAISYRQQIGPSDILLDASRAVLTSDEDESRAVDTLALGYVYNLDPRARLGLGVAYVRTAGTPSDPRLERMDVNATYSRALTEDWDLTTGAVYRTRDEEGVGSVSSSSVFLSLERRFELRF